MAPDPWEKPSRGRAEPRQSLHGGAPRLLRAKAVRKTGFVEVPLGFDAPRWSTQKPFFPKLEGSATQQTEKGRGGLGFLLRRRKTGLKGLSRRPFPWFEAPFPWRRHHKKDRPGKASSSARSHPAEPAPRSPEKYEPFTPCSLVYCLWYYKPPSKRTPGNSSLPQRGRGP